MESGFLLLQHLQRSDIDSTVAAVFRQRAYQNQPGVVKSLWQKLWDWIFEILSEVFRGLGKIPQSPPLARFALALIVILLLVAIGYRIYLRRRTISTDMGFSGAERKNWISPWAMAQKLAAEGRYTDAVHYLYIEMLRKNARAGYIVLHPSKTSGDYVKEFGKRATLDHAQAFSNFILVYEMAVYGTGLCSRNEYSQLMELASPFIGQHE